MRLSPDAKLQRKTAMRVATAASWQSAERPVRAAFEGGPKLLDFNGLGYRKRILQLDA